MASASRTLSRSLSSVWRTLRSMRTALILLLVVALASVAGSLVPQAPISLAAVRRMYEEHPLRARIFEGLGLFDVYGSWWFTLAYALLLVSLASCLAPRTRAVLRGLRQRPQAMRELEGMRHFVEASVPGTPDEALTRSRRVLRRRRFRVSNGAAGIAAEKGLAREAGSLLFHWSLLLLLLGVMYGKSLGFMGRATVVEGETWTEAHASYDVPPVEGRFFTERMHAGFRIRVEDFDASYHENGVPSDFVTRLRVLRDDGSPAPVEELRVNEPVEVEGVKLYQFGYGWAPVLEIRKDGRLLTQDPVVFVTPDAADLSRPWRGVIKLPSLRPQVGIALRLLPDLAAGLGGGPMLEARNAFVFFEAYRGDLRLEGAQSAFSLDRTALDPWVDGGIGLGQTKRLPGGLTISFPELREYTQLQVKRDPGLPLMLAAAALILAGLLPALYSSRRRVWVKAFQGRDATRVQVAGLALQRRAAFDEEFRAIASEVVGERRADALVG